MAAFDIGGVWEGEYTYLPTERLPVAPPPVGFTLTARTGWFGAFRGVIQDEPGRGSLEPAAARGRVVGLSLSFTKLYPALILFHGGRCMTLREYLASEKSLPLDVDVPGFPIVYRGTYEPDSQCARGVWQIAPQQVRFVSAGQTVSVKNSGAEGRWVMYRR